MKSCVLAGGCFWCMAKPYYEYEGIINVYSGYSGGDEVNPTYEDVQAQKSHLMECVKLVYDENIINYVDILNIYFDTIDPFDDGGQFIDRGNSYTTAIFYNSPEMKEIIEKFLNEKQKLYDKKIVVKVKEEGPFYMAEDYHQDYAIKNPELMKEELILSGRIKD